MKFDRTATTYVKSISTQRTKAFNVMKFSLGFGLKGAGVCFGISAIFTASAGDVEGGLYKGGIALACLLAGKIFSNDDTNLSQPGPPKLG
jgi:hypothetical protein